MLELPAPAKINLHLHITGLTKRGYHLLDTSFAYVDVGDILHIHTSANLQVSCSDPALNGEHNLVFRVLQALRSQFSVSHGLHVHVEKRLPAQAGLGGGSSDAATALMAASHLWGLGLDSHELSTFAAPFGADIPCFLFGSASLAQGIGEQLSPLQLPEEIQHVVLAHPGTGLSTAEVFARFDQAHGMHPGQLTPPGAKANMRAGFRGATAEQLPLGENMLEDVSVAMCSQLGDMLEFMRREQASSWMSGSGTACVAFCESAGQAKQLTGRLAAEGLAAWVHTGTLLARHPLHDSGMQPADWGVAKR